MSNLGFFSQGEVDRVIERSQASPAFDHRGYPAGHDWQESPIPSILRVCCQEHVVTCAACAQQFIKAWYAVSDEPSLLGLKEIEPCAAHQESLRSAPKTRTSSHSMTPKGISDGVMRGLMVSARCFE